MTNVRSGRIDQAMAAAAAALLPDGLPDDQTRELRTRYRQLPVRLRTSGLAATYAYLVAKSGVTDLGVAYQRVADGLRTHLVERRGLIDRADATTNLEFLDAIAKLPMPVYVRACAEAELLAGWLSRLADAKYPSASTGSPAVPESTAGGPGVGS